MKYILALFTVTLNITGHSADIEVDQLTTSTTSAKSTNIHISDSLTFSSNQRLIVTGNNGSLITQSSVTASSFFGDGCRLTGIGSTNLCDDQFFSGANTFNSSFTINSGGREIIISTSSTVNNLRISQFGIPSFYPALHTSSRTTIPATSTTQTSLGPCISGSTVSITTSGGRAEVVFTGFGTGPSNGAILSFLQDGQFVSDLGSQVSVNLLPSGNRRDEFSFSYITDPPPGPHSYCLSLMTRGAVAAQLFNDSVSGNLFYVKELK
jgi:hypothetical protein